MHVHVGITRKLDRNSTMEMKAKGKACEPDWARLCVDRNEIIVTTMGTILFYNSLYANRVSPKKLISTFEMLIGLKSFTTYV